jgi:hypothetical protein
MAELHPINPAHTSSLSHDAQRRSRLAALGLSEELLLDSLRYAYLERDRCSGNDVAAAAGYAVWGKPLRYLRDKLLPLGWMRDGVPRLESVVSPDRRFRITSAAGDCFTGDSDHMPATDGLKGRRALEAIGDNGQGALDLAGESVEPIPPMFTYYFIHRLDSVKERINSELSVPTNMTIGRTAKKGRIDAFKDRLILSAIEFENDIFLDADIEEEFSEDLDIQVPRRSASE